MLPPRCEIIEIRGDLAGRRRSPWPTTSQQKRVVLGETGRTDDRSPASPQCEARVVVNGGEVARGRGEAVMGDPVNAVVWLAAKLARIRPGAPVGRPTFL